MPAWGNIFPPEKVNTANSMPRANETGLNTHKMGLVGRKFHTLSLKYEKEL
jgi:hypothetical protein